ncbi:cbb3-type cytochrome c oxidase subunit I [Trinickia sp. NRRL B-1857]|uniref:nitric-oxide reductase large subunit n=1 Tax=Trinickia sp. NRRL B-1857 TaxID=3162879 RepID=UPI003D2898CA
MDTNATILQRMEEDRVSAVLKWVLLGIAIITFALLAWATLITYRTSPPQPDRFTAPDGTLVMTAQDIEDGKASFQRADLMDYGSIYGMGSYFGEDYTAEYLLRLGQVTADNLARERFGKTFAALGDDDRRAVQAAMQRQLQDIDLSRAQVPLSAAVAAALSTLQAEIAQQLTHHDFIKGWTQAYSLDDRNAAKTADFILYSALTTVARRPGSNVSWTQNWPYEPFVGNVPTTSTFGWTWASYCFTFFCFGAVLFVYHRYIRVDDQGTMDPTLIQFRGMAPSQRKVGKYFLVVAAVLLLQIAAGAILGHYYSDRASFYGLHFDDVLPFNFWRSIHIQAPIVWIGLSWIGAGLFLAPAISGREPAGQGPLVDLLFWATVVIVAGALIGDYLGIMGFIGKGWFWFGNQGLSYLELGRFWQIGFFAGLAFWSVLVLRGLWPNITALKEAAQQFWTGHIRLEHLIWASTTNIALLYVFGMVPLFGVNPSFTITDFWRWWVVHLWVEQSFEFFAAAISAYLLMGLGLVSRQLAERSVYLELILIFLGGVLGTGHHIYWVGASGLWVPVGSMFSFIEVLPLVLLILDAMEHHSLIKKQHQFRYGLAYTYVLGSAFWNFVGAGVFGGGTLNAPLVNYYEHGTFLTLNHAHTSLFGAFGLLAIGLIYFCLRYAAADRTTFSDKLGLWAFWLYNAGLVLWIVLNFFPVGWPQLNAVYDHGLAYARSLAFYDTTGLWQWLRFVGDIPFAIAALLMAFDFILKMGPMIPAIANRWGIRRQSRQG